MDPGKYGLIRFGDYDLDTQKRLLLRSGVAIPLMPKAFDLLKYLVENNGRVIDKDELMAAVWPNTVVEESNLSQNISILRRTLGEKRAENLYIATVPGRGYKFVADVSFGAVSDGQPEPDVPGDEAVNHRPPEETSEVPRRRVLPAAIVIAAAAVLVLGGVYLWNRPSSRSDAAAIRSIAVLPFRPVSSDPGDHILEVGMADTLIMKLSESTDIVVRPLSSVRQFTSVDTDALDAGRRLGVEAVLEGTLQRVGDKLRVNVRLFRTEDGSSLWGATYDEPVADIFALQDAIAHKAAGALKAKLREGSRPYTQSVDAYQLFVRGRLSVLKATRPELLEGIEHFRKAIELDANYALAYAGMADAYRTLALGGEMRPADVFPHARSAAQRAVVLDPSLAEAHTALGASLFWCDWNWAESEKHLKRALELNPNNADAHSEYAFLLSNLGRNDEALELAQRALELDPLNLRAKARYGQFLNHAGRTGEALAILQQTMALDPEYWLAYQFATSTHLVRKEYPEAVSTAEMTGRLNQVSTRPIAYGGYARAKLGETESARQALKQLTELAKQKYVPNVNIAVLQLGLGDKEAAISRLERAAEEKDPWMTFIKVEPIWFELSDDPRFQRIVRSMQLQ
jgi:DNA-binding winged helix-turn-helix (wHTH) protein/TolB-like protein/Flp pilus assembly protein TadD